MRIKKFVADTAKEALLQVREELGPKAVILKTQKAPGKTFLGFPSKNKIEITAALDEELFEKPFDAKSLSSAQSISQMQLYNSKGAKASLLPNLRESAKTESALSQERIRLAEIHDDVEEVKTVLRNLADHIRHQNMPSLPEKVQEFCRDLIDGEMNEALAFQAGVKLKENLKEIEIGESEKVYEEGIKILSSSIQTSGPFQLADKRAAKIMFIGPTGAGKTTTLAKLAAQYGLLQRKRIRIISADTYRIAAIEQLRTFAEISDIPMEVVFTPEEMQYAIARFTPSCDFILIDTAGRSQLKEEHMEDLKAMVEATAPDELHLVLSATTKESDLHTIADYYRLLGVNRLLFTKLDETTKYGSLYNLLFKSRVPLSYVTTGQSVPDDIEEGDSLRLVQRLFKEKAA
jgi:flagellar biosynthesis protein FlhF